MDGSTTTVTDYLDGFQYDNQVLQFFPHAEGYVKATVMTMGPGNPVYGFNYVYNYTDHLGNVRLSYAKDPQTGDLKVMEENNYYPYGLKHHNYSSSISLGFQKQLDEWGVILAPVTNNPYNYKYNGKELQDELGLNMYDMDMRMYDPAIARWVVMDPVIHHSMSPYNAFDNNPVFWADPSGADAEQSSGDGESPVGAGDTPANTRIMGAIGLDNTMAFNFISYTGYGQNGSSKKQNSNEDNGDPENGDPEKNKNEDPEKNKNEDPEIKKLNKLNGEIIGKKEKSEQDNNYNFFYKIKDKWLRRGAEYLNDGGANESTIAVNAHGGKSSISTPEGRFNANDLHNYLYKYNDLYKSSFDNKTTINLRLNACNTGNVLAKDLSLINPYLNVTAPITTIKGVFNSDGTWVTYNNGIKIK